MSLCAFVRSLIEDHTVVSVGPYILYILAEVSVWSSFNKLSGNASPPSIITFRFLIYSYEDVSLNNNDILAGVVCNIFTLFFKHNSFNFWGIFCSSSLAITIVNPFCNGSKDSKTNISKQKVVTETITSSKWITLQVASIKLFTFLCVSITPLGFPVEPEVYIT